MSDPNVRPTPPWLFAFTILPFGAAVGYVTIAAPFWLEQRQVSLAAIGAVSGISMAPHAFKFAWAPLVDLGGRRRRWFLLTALLTAAALVALSLLSDPSRHLLAFTVLATLAQVAGTTAAVAADGLMAITTRAGDQGKAGGWRMAGNVGFTGLLGALALGIAGRSSVPIAGGVLGVLVAISSLAVLRIEEPAPPVAAGRARLAEARRQLAAVFRDVGRTLGSRVGWTGLVICAVPVGAGALTNLFSAMGSAYGASPDEVALVNGLGGGLLGAAGAVIGGFLADRMNRRLAYGLAGGLTALSGLAMMLGPLTPLTYGWGTLLYNFTNGIAFAALAAFILEMVGHGPGAATKYTSFIAVSNLASSYVTALDGWGSRVGGLAVRGPLLVDALLTLAGIGVLLGMLALSRRRPPHPVAGGPDPGQETDPRRGATLCEEANE